MTDILQASTGDIDISQGDINYTNASLQHQSDCIQSQRGTLKHAPGVGVGIEDFMNDESQDEMLRRIRQELTKDGMRIEQIKTTPAGAVEITGDYQS